MFGFFSNRKTKELEMQIELLNQRIAEMEEKFLTKENLDDYISTEVESAIENAVESAVEGYDFTDAVEAAIDEVINNATLSVRF